MAVRSFEAQQEADMFCCLLGLTCQGACGRMTKGLGQFCAAGHLTHPNHDTPCEQATSPKSNPLKGGTHYISKRTRCPPPAFWTCRC